jgi:hypothetical protein
MRRLVPLLNEVLSDGGLGSLDALAEIRDLGGVPAILAIEQKKEARDRHDGEAGQEERQSDS